MNDRRLISVWLTQEQYRGLDLLSEQRSGAESRTCSISELVRQGIDLLLGAEESADTITYRGPTQFLKTTRPMGDQGERIATDNEDGDE